MKKIDAKGKPCPEPVTLTKKEVDRGETELAVLLDNPVSATNVRRFLESKNFSVLLKDDDGVLTISARKKETGPAKAPADAKKTAASQPEPSGQAQPAPKEALAVLLTSRTLGQGDPQLGEVLMKGFLGTLAQMDDAPAVVALMNEGVKLALYDSSSCDHLKTLEQKSVPVLVCGTCVNHFQVADQIGAGTISNMFEILETLNKSGKILSL